MHHINKSKDATGLSRGRGASAIADNIKIALRNEKIPYSHCLIDEVGVGGGVLDQVRGAKGFIANSSPIEDTKAAPIFINPYPLYLSQPAADSTLGLFK